MSASGIRPGTPEQPSLFTNTSIRPLATSSEVDNFGSFLKDRCGSLEAGFKALDHFAVGQLDSNAFSQGASRLGYTMDVVPVFHVLDNSRNGVVSLQSFMSGLTQKEARSAGMIEAMGGEGSAIQRLLTCQFKAGLSSSLDAPAGPASGSAQDIWSKLERLVAEVTLMKERAQTQQRVWQETQARIETQLVSMPGVHTAEQMDTLREKLDLAVARQKDELDALRNRFNSVDPDMIRTLVDDRMTTCRAVLVQEHSQAMVAAKAAADDTSKLTEYVKEQIGRLDTRVQSLVSDHVSFRAQTEEIIADLGRNSKAPAVSDGTPGSFRASLLHDGGGMETKIVAQEAKEAVKALRAESKQQMDRIVDRLSKMDLRLEATGRLMGEEAEMQVSKGLQLKTDMAQRFDALSERLEAVSTRAVAAEARVQEIAVRPRAGCSVEEVSEIVSKAVGKLNGSLTRIAEVEDIAVNSHHSVEAVRKSIADLEQRMVELSSTQGSLMGDDVAKSIRTSVLAEVQGDIHDKLRQLEALRASETARGVNDGAEGSADAAAGRREAEEALAKAFFQLQQDATRLAERVSALERQGVLKESSTAQIDELNARIVDVELGLQSMKPIAEGGVAVAKHTATRLGELEAKIAKISTGDDGENKRRLAQLERGCSERLIAAERGLADVRSEARAQASAVERLQQDMLVERSRQDARQQAGSDAMMAKLQALISKVDGRCAEGGGAGAKSPKLTELDPRGRLSLPTPYGLLQYPGGADIGSPTARTVDTPAMTEHTRTPSVTVSDRNPRSPHHAEHMRFPAGPSRSRPYTPVGTAPDALGLPFGTDKSVSSVPSTSGGTGGSTSFPRYRQAASGASRSMSPHHMGQAGEEGEQWTTLARTAKVLQGLREENLRLREENVEMRESQVEGRLGGARRSGKAAPESSQLEAVMEAPAQPPIVAGVQVPGPASVEVAPMAKLTACKNAGHGQASSQPPISRYPTTPGAQQRAQMLPGSSKGARPTTGPSTTARMGRPSAGAYSRGYNSVDGLASPASTASGPAFVPNSLQVPRSTILYPPPRSSVQMR